MRLNKIALSTILAIVASSSFADPVTDRIYKTMLSMSELDQVPLLYLTR